MKLYELLSEDGRIVKGVNTTPDVGVGQIPIEARKFGNTVDQDGRPPTLSKRVKGKSTNVLFNLGLAESVDQRIRNNFNEFAKYCAFILELDELPRIVMTGKDLDETFGFFDPDSQSITVSFNRRHQMDVMRTLAHELVHYKQRQHKENLDGSDGSPDENEANAMAGVILRRWAHKNPQLFAETQFTDMERAIMEGGHSLDEIEHQEKLAGDLFNALSETIRKQGDKYVIYSKSGDKKLGTYTSRKAAEKRLRQIEYFKHAGK